MEKSQIPQTEEQQAITSVLDYHRDVYEHIKSGGCIQACPECLKTCTLTQNHSGQCCCPDGHRW